MRLIPAHENRKRLNSSRRLSKYHAINLLQHSFSVLHEHRHSWFSGWFIIVHIFDGTIIQLTRNRDHLRWFLSFLLKQLINNSILWSTKKFKKNLLIHKNGTSVSGFSCCCLLAISAANFLNKQQNHPKKTNEKLHFGTTRKWLRTANNGQLLT